MFIAMENQNMGTTQSSSISSGTAATIRTGSPYQERVGNILDSLPLNEEFNWVELVSKEITTQMLATLFDFPFEDRHLLPYWSDVATTSETVGIEVDMNERQGF
ncbi:MAG: hypothetical protein CM1200mP12_03780 [Gammaproteobacteria bacterium]|nr:MAG: hypothetical protein CM1200mP12_03780 [Gammaproteobacteria bacterium]